MLGIDDKLGVRFALGKGVAAIESELAERLLSCGRFSLLAFRKGADRVKDESGPWDAVVADAERAAASCCFHF